ncbi:MAG: hypothetical protein CL912_06685 [Deltaproteobacteria bacterium]|nr:hypothetical protein [Deltaproteobacteria bacterium]
MKTTHGRSLLLEIKKRLPYNEILEYTKVDILEYGAAVLGFPAADNTSPFYPGLLRSSACQTTSQK